MQKAGLTYLSSHCQEHEFAVSKSLLNNMVNLWINNLLIQLFNKFFLIIFSYLITFKAFYIWHQKTLTGKVNVLDN